MRFALTSEHVAFFHEHRYVEFEQIISREEADLLAVASQEALHTKLRTFFLSGKTPQCADVFRAGRDLWRENKVIKQVVLRSQLASVAAELAKEPSLRLAFDQSLLSAPSSHDTLLPCFARPLSLSEGSCIQGLAGALLLQLSDPYPEPPSLPPPSLDDEPAPLALFPQKKGSGIFFSPLAPLSLGHFTDRSRGDMHQLLIVYGIDKSLYKREKLDPHIHHLKRFGYQFGDCLKKDTHPIFKRAF